MNLQGKSVLFFAPVFFGYDLEIKKQLESYGAKVYLYNERPSTSFFAKAIIRIRKKLVSLYINQYFKDIINKHKSHTIDYVFIIKGEVINLSILNQLKVTFADAKFILYLWDSLKNYPDTRATLDFYDKVFTFDYDDSLIGNVKFRPLFYIGIYKNLATNNFLNYDLLFVGTVHTDRWLFLKKILDEASKHQLKVYYYLYVQSPIIFIFRKIFDKRLRSLPIKYVKLKSLSKESIAELMSQSKVILDIQHPKQTGLTMRCIEVLGARKKLITTNETIKNYDFFHDDDIMLINRENPILYKYFFQKEYTVMADKVYDNYSVDGWLKEIFYNL
jgi:hypothetical protein